MVDEKEFDLIVVGAGHAGLEAALIADKLGMKVGLVSLSYNKIGDMPCNPSIGGIAKGHLVREIDALGGEMGKAVDYTGIQFRMLNRSKGPAVWGPRAQADKELYIKYFQDLLKKKKNIEFIGDEVTELNERSFKGSKENAPPTSGTFIKDVCPKTEITGVRLKNNGLILSKKVIVTTGTFLRGKLFTGMKAEKGGRYGEPPADHLSKSIKNLGLIMGRLKTGTPARIYKNSIDFSKTERQEGDDDNFSFSFWHNKYIENKVNCYITYTNENTHKIIREGLKFSPLYQGMIEGIGPRYCPSIEDKVVKFPDKKRHQIFLEPEGLKSDLIYPNGISSSLPADYQDRFLRTLPGLKNIKIARYGYAVEYDFVQPTELYKTLETKKIKGLYFAGQINGTSGYEEAAAQGLIAGINAVLSLSNAQPFILKRSEAYIGVLIDDLVLKGVTEPYRLFTSQAEYRLLLRQDTADLRLSKYALKYGLLSKKEEIIFENKMKEKNKLEELLKQEKIILNGKGIRLAIYAKRDVTDAQKRFLAAHSEFDKDLVFTVANNIKYEGYIKREMEKIRDEEKLNIRLPDNIDYNNIPSLKNEAKERLSKIRPKTLLDASKMSGISSADITVLLVYLKK